MMRSSGTSRAIHSAFGFEPRSACRCPGPSLQALRGVDLVVAVSFVVEIGDIRRFENRASSWAISGWYRRSDRPARASGAARSPDGQPAHSPVARRERLDLPVPAAGRREETSEARSCISENPRDRLEGTIATQCSLPSILGARQEDDGHLHRRRPGTRGVHVGSGDGGPATPAGGLIYGLKAAVIARASAGVGPRQGNSRQTLCGRLVDARRKSRESPGRISVLRYPTRASELDHRRPARPTSTSAR